MTGLTDKSTKVAKTIKMYINGEFPRTEIRKATNLTWLDLELLSY